MDMQDLEFLHHPSGIWVPRTKRPTVIDLFCGCGGFSAGFLTAGFEVLAGVDNDVHATHTYLMNLGSYPVEIHYVIDQDRKRLEDYFERSLKRKARKCGGLINSIMTSGSGWIKDHPEIPPVRHFWFGDIRQLKGEDMLNVLGLKPGDVDVVVGGPPCQGFSYAGRRNVMDPRNSLVFEFARMVLEIRPKALVFENVPGIETMVTPDGVPVLDAVSLMLQEGGWGLWESIKTTLLTTSGAGAAIIGKPRPRRGKDADPEDDTERRPSLFDRALEAMA